MEFTSQQVSITSHLGEDLYLGSKVLDPSRRFALTWIGRDSEFGKKWELVSANPSNPNLVRIRNVDYDEFLYVASKVLDEQRRLALSWIGDAGVDPCMVWELIPTEEPQFFRIKNVKNGEFLYCGSQCLDSLRRYALTWIGDIRSDPSAIWRIKPNGTAFRGTAEIRSADIQFKESNAEGLKESNAGGLKNQKGTESIDIFLDLVFICDCTGSMSSYIAAAQQNINAIITSIQQSEKCDVRFGLVAYRDHPPQDNTYVTQISTFTSIIADIQSAVGAMSAQGGGDGPEAVTAGMYDALHMDWREEATKICVLIADAPPHGIEPSGDGFPNGDPDGKDPLAICREMAAKGIVCYAVGCEPALGNYRCARDFMLSVAEITGGQAIALSSSSLLAQVILGTAAEELNLQHLMRDVQEEVFSSSGGGGGGGGGGLGDLSEDAALNVDSAVCSRVFEAMRSREVRTKQMKSADKILASPHLAMFCRSERLSDVKTTLEASAPAPPAPSPRFDRVCAREGGGGRDILSAPAAALELCEISPPAPSILPSAASLLGAEPTSPVSPGSYEVSEDTISREQVSRMIRRTYYMHR